MCYPTRVRPTLSCGVAAGGSSPGTVASNGTFLMEVKMVVWKRKNPDDEEIEGPPGKGPVEEE